MNSIFFEGNDVSGECPGGGHDAEIYRAFTSAQCRGVVSNPFHSSVSV